MYLIRIFYLVFIIPHSLGINQTLIDQFRRDFIFQLINQIQFPMLSFSLQNTAPQLKPLNGDIVFFYLYNRKNPFTPIAINKDTTAINTKHDVKILVHGWTEHYYVEWARNMTAAYLRKGKYNVIVLDWSKRGDANYVSACQSVPEVAEIIGDYIVEKLVKERKVSLKRIHLISHSLGCHVAGLTGQRVFEKAGRKVARITALDPAAPIFETFGMANPDRLSPDDAEFVDIVHTDGGVLGFNKAIGTVDFYPNGGTAIQPGCSLLRPDITYDDLFCSHARSHKMFLRTIVEPDIKAHRCDSWDKFSQGQCNTTYAVVFGDNTPRSIRGSYFLRTPVNILPHIFH